MRDRKITIWEKNFSDNYKPSLLIKLIKKFEVYRRDVIIDLLPKSGGTIVDLACGDGELLIEVKNRFRHLIGFDIANNRINKAIKKIKESNLEKFLFQSIDLDKGIPLKSNSVDVVTCEAGISYFYSTEAFIDEVWRILKARGIFIIEVPNYTFLPRRLTLFFGKLPKTSSFPGFGDGGALHYFTHSILRNLLEEAKFKVIMETNSGILPKIRSIWPELLSGDIIMKAIKNG